MSYQPVLDENSSEHLHQAYFVQFIRQEHPYIFIFAIPNGGKRSMSEALRLKVEGVVPGVSDLLLMFLDGSKRILFVEMKKVKGSSTSAEQKEFLATVEAAGHYGFVAKGFEHAKTQFLDYLQRTTPCQ